MVICEYYKHRKLVLCSINLPIPMKNDIVCYHIYLHYYMFSHLVSLAVNILYHHFPPLPFSRFPLALPFCLTCVPSSSFFSTFPSLHIPLFHVPLFPSLHVPPLPNTGILEATGVGQHCVIGCFKCPKMVTSGLQSTLMRMTRLSVNQVGRKTKPHLKSTFIFLLLFYFLLMQFSV